MRRGTLVLCLASGCDVAFEALPSQLPTCGEFRTAIPQVFDDALGDVREFSVDASGARGIVRAVTAANPAGGIEAVSLVDGVWRHDIAGGKNFRELEREFLLAFGHMSARGDMFASELPDDDFAYRVFRWQLDGNMRWVRQEDVTPQIPDESTFAGGEIEVEVTPMSFFREVPIIHRDRDFARFMTIAQSDPGKPLEWHEALDEGRQITAAINEVHDATAAGLAFGAEKRTVLAYAAYERGREPKTTGSRIYLTEKRNAVFAAGVPLRELEDAVDGGELVEPHLAPDCSALYFRRTVSAADAGTIFRAPNLDSPASNP